MSAMVKLYTVSDISRTTHYSISRVRDFIREQTLRASYITGTGTRLFTQEEVDKITQRRRDTFHIASS